MNENLKELFKEKYKFIEFRRGSTTTTTTTISENKRNDEDKTTDVTSRQEAATDEESSPESIKKFYEDLIVQNDNEKNKPTLDDDEDESQYIKIESTPTVKSRPSQSPAPVAKTSTQPIVAPTQSDYLKASQHNNLDLIESYLDKNSSMLDVRDEYGWNALMIATCSFNNKIVKYFLDTQIDNPLFSNFLYAKDLAKHDAESLALKSNNLNAYEMIRKAKQQMIVKSSPTIKESTDKSTGSQPMVDSDVDEFYCELCKAKFKESKNEHFKSIVHLVNENERSSLKLKHNYYLRSNNVGYQLLCKSGWNEQSGLGVKEQGVVYPIKTRLKLDRKGIGMNEPSSDNSKSSSSTMVGSNQTQHKQHTKYTVNRKLVRLQQNDQNESQRSRRIESNLKNFKKNQEKSKNLERRLRSYFNE